MERFEDVPVFVPLVDGFGNPSPATSAGSGEKHGFAMIRVTVDQESNAHAASDWLQIGNQIVHGVTLPFGVGFH
jgi:hypothetical protein